MFKKFSEYFGYLQDKMTKMTEDKIEFDWKIKSDCWEDIKSDWIKKGSS